MRFGRCSPPQPPRPGAVFGLLAAIWLTGGAYAGAWSLVAQPGVPGAAFQRPGQAPAGKPAPQTPSGSFAGRVTTAEDPATGIARARVILSAEALAAPRVTITDAQGHFFFEQLPAGAYSMTVAASGYAAQRHLPRQSGPARPLLLAHGERVTGIDVSLPRAGVIAGQILDEDDRPFVGAIVEALASRTEGGQAVLVPLSSATTDDRGEFRLAGLPAGQYLVSASDPAFADVGDHKGPLRYAATYHPGVVRVDQAARVTVTPAGESGRVVFKLQIVRAAHISGLIRVPGDRQLASGTVALSPVHTESLPTGPFDDVRMDADGGFQFRNVMPGEYQIRARAETDPRDLAMFATYLVTVNGHDVTNVRMALLPGASLEGLVAWEAVGIRAPATFEGVRVRAPLADGTDFGDALTGEVGADGRYHVRGLMPGSHVLSVEGLPHPWVLKSVLWRGRDITDAAIDVASQDRLADINITLTDAATEVNGTVTDHRGRPVIDALVLIIPVSSNAWTRTSRRLGRLQTSERGTYRLRGLPPGEYRVIAMSGLDASEIYQKELLATLVAAGSALTLEERQSRVVDLGLTPLSALRRTPAR